ncbi:hypothetical protein LCGC14_1890610 [marine sediment metagenome]|uniref:Phage portal protein n=1 Tax=marine sediment metagenome TaxID=412755 RepID=A0A0F9IXT4_9ZZZZ
MAIYGGTIGSLPWILYKRIDEKNKVRWVDHPLYNCLHNQANSEMTSLVWREISMNHLLLLGNAYSQIIRNAKGQTRELWPLDPTLIEIKRDENGKIYYELRVSAGKNETFPAENILHIPGLGYDGRRGYSVLALAREGLGLGLSMETFQARFYGKGTNLGGVLEHPGKLGDIAHEHLKKSIKEEFAGINKSHGVFIAEEGMKYIKLGMPLQDAQFLGSRLFQILEFCRWFNLSAYKLKDYSNATFSNIEHLAIEFVQDSIRPWAVRLEQHVNWKCLKDDERKSLFNELLLDGLLRGDVESRNKALAVQRQNGVISANDWRAIENKNPLEGPAGDAIWQPLNMIDANAPPEEKPSEDKVEEEPEEKKLISFESRASRAIKSRRRMAEAFKPLYRNMEKEILKKERAGILKIVKKTLTQRDADDFIFAIDEFYEKFRKFIHNQFAGINSEYGNAIYPIAAEEVNADVEQTAEFAVYLNEFADHSTNRYVESSRGQLKQVVLKHRENDPAEAVEKRLDEWDERRPDKVAGREVVDLESGIAQFVYYGAGFRTVWVTFGKSCPYCMSLNGRTVSQGMNFLNAGQAFEPDGAVNGPLVVTQNISHPAAHSGCDCSVSAG